VVMEGKYIVAFSTRGEQQNYLSSSFARPDGRGRPSPHGQSCSAYTGTRMKSIIVGTAGHIDHGKTALVKALTGIDADRLEEEKRRGITIDLGFAHMELAREDGERLRFGFVDVPGHERFVRNMLAGVGGIDFVLLVIAADEGIKPQTREHFDICRLLAIQRGITVLTKSDTVDAETLEVVRLEVEEFLRGSFLENSPIVAVSSLKNTGLQELKNALVQMAGETPARDSNAIARLPIDRVFTMKGFGTVVTGTLIAGTIRKEDELELFPSGKRVRVRGVQVHGKSADHASAGERTALNLSGIEKHELERGMVLASPGLLQVSSRIDTKLSLLPSAKPLKSGARVHLHTFTSEVIASVAPYDLKQLPPGDDAFAQLLLSEPLLLLPGDRFIIRQFSPVVTSGGGEVLDAFPPRKATTSDRLEFLRSLSAGNVSASVFARIQRHAQQGVTLTQLTSETGLEQVALDRSLADLLREKKIMRLRDLAMDAAAFRALTATLIKSVAEFHARNPLVAGIAKESLREQTGLSQVAFEAGLSFCVGERTLAITGELLHLPGRGVVMKDEEAESRRTIEHAFASAGLKVPALRDVLSSLKIDKTRAQKIMTLLLREKILIKVSDDLVFHQAALTELRKSLAAQRLISPRLDVARFKEITGVSRKYAIPLLEYLDRERVTKRVGDDRVIL
jgi:selenocysteine-specific elongation factor